MLRKYVEFLKSDKFDIYMSLTEDEVVEMKFSFIKKLFPLEDCVKSQGDEFVIDLIELRNSTDLELIQNKMKQSLSLVLNVFHISEDGMDKEYVPFLKFNNQLFCRIIISLLLHNLCLEASLLTFRLSRYRYVLKLINQKSFSPFEIVYIQTIQEIERKGIQHKEPKIV